MERVLQSFDTDRRVLLFLAAAGFLLLLPSIWSETSITGQDEYWLTFRTPMETLARGDWMTTWVNDKPRLAKPPLMYWAIMATYKIFGISPFAARIWGLLSGVGMIVSSALLARIVFGRHGLMAGLITAATLGVAIEGRRAMLDLPMACLTSLAVCFALLWWKSFKIRHLLPAVFLLAMAVLVKGPLALFFFAAPVLSGLLIFNEWRSLPRRCVHLITGFCLLLALCLPWPIMMMQFWPSFSGTLSVEMADRRFGGIRPASSLSALGGALGLVFPWTLITVAAVLEPLRGVGARAKTVRKMDRDRTNSRTDHHADHEPDRGRDAGQSTHRKKLWIVLWYVLTVTPFFFMKSFERYMLIVIPPLSVLCAQWLIDERTFVKPLLLKASLILTSAAALFFCAFSLWFRLDPLPAAICLASVCLLLWTAFRGKGLHTVVLSTALVLMSTIGILYPALGFNAMPPDIGRMVREHPVAVFNTSQPSMLSIRLKKSAVPINESNLLAQIDRHDTDVFIFAEKKDAPGLEAAAARLLISIEKAGEFNTFYSRKSWIRFTRADATLNDWKTAFLARSLEGLKSTIVFYRARMPESGGRVGTETRQRAAS